MADISLDHEAVTKAFSGLGVDEKALISTVGRWQHDHKNSFRKSSPSHFLADNERQFEKWNEKQVELIKHEVLRFKSALVLWTMHPWERDARLLKEALTKGPQGYNLVIEIACTRSSEELLGARKAYHSLFDSSVEEDVASHAYGHERKFLVALVSAYRYEGTRVHDGTAKSEAEALHHAIKNIHPVEDEEVVRILCTRSKPHLTAIFRHYKELFGKELNEDLHGNPSLKVALECLVVPAVYFSEALDAALRKGADEFTQEALTRVIVSQADGNMEEIKAAYQKRFGIPLSQKIEETCLGNFKEFLLTLVARGE
ncbi:annexin D4-like [Chenopodium quinoa]|uniref:annexin D4-like n=1 Tax=Chenopodium quinoa TaxID=63459 RepID=UPI000B793EBC|nr:annexin D4-like [Chenopodium quinoa]